MTKGPRHPQRGRSTDSYKPLSPCLVHRSPSSSSQSPTKQRQITRRPSLPSIHSEHLGKPLTTIPLRDCCTTCLTVTEECLKEGEHWEEKFSRGARRRRSSSVSSDDFSMPQPSSPLKSCGFTPVEAKAGFVKVGVVASRTNSHPSINVDEVDRRRRSGEHPRAASDPIPVTEATSPSFSAYPIKEEDEDQLFPLPSPRRSNSNSPASSLTPSPVPSPTASVLRLKLKAASSSHDSLPTWSGSDEGIIPHSLARSGRCEKGLLTPHIPPSSGSSRSIPSPGKPQILIPPTSSFNPHVRATSSPDPSPTSPVSPYHLRNAAVPDTLPAQDSPVIESRNHTELVRPTRSRTEEFRPSSTRQPSTSPTMKRKTSGFSPSAFFREALKGVGTISTTASGYRM